MSSRKPNPRKRSRSRGGSTSSTSNNTNNNAERSSANVRVCVRIRPFNQAERESHNSKSVVRVLNENVLIFDPNEQESPNYFRGRRQRRNIMQRKHRDMQFAFDHVFAEHTQQQYVYEHTTKAIVDSLLNGYNCSVFAYGATGAGKTFTMLGAPGFPGITFLTMMELYQRINEIREEKSCDVRVSYLEVYNENIRDLLVPSGYLAVREDPSKGVVVSGLSLQQPQSAEELLRMLEYGNQNRTQHPTDANAQSSRSHAVFQVFVKQKDRTANLSTDFRVAKMSLIDLAGSERATVTTNRGQRFREGANINRSLLALGNCINALADKRNKSMHIPYRNSKLTRLLKDSLGGNCRTVMIAAISPSSLSYEDTYNTLKYANRAKEIKSNLKRNIVSVDFHVSRYEQIVAELRTEVTELKTKLSGYETGTLQVAKRRSIEIAGDDEIQRLQGELHNIFVQRSSIRKELMELESSDRDLSMKIMRKQLTLERVRIIYGQTMQADKTMSKSERVIAASKARQGRLRGRKAEVEQRMKDNEDWLGRVEAEMRLAGKDGPMPEVLQEAIRTRHIEIELKDSRRQIKHLKKMAKQHDSQVTSSEKLVISLLSVVRKQYFLIKGAGLVTSDTDAEFETIQKAVEGDREVAWADQSVSEADGDSSEGLITDLKSLIELPILSCVNVTPRAPHLKQRDRARSCSSTPSRTSQTNTPMNPALLRVQSQTQMTPRLQSAGPATEATPQVAQPQSATKPVTPNMRQTPSNILTPHQASNILPQATPSNQQATPGNGQAMRIPLETSRCTPGSRVVAPSHPPSSCTKYGPPQRIAPDSVGQPVRTPSHAEAPTSAVKNIHTSNGAVHASGANAAGQVTNSEATSGSPKAADCKKDLSLTETEFVEEGIAPLKTPPSAECTSVLSSTVVVDSTAQTSQEIVVSVGQTESVVVKQPVARAISFEPLVTNSSHKISPVTGTTMTYAQVVSTPPQAKTHTTTVDQSRKPLGALTNSPQLAPSNPGQQHSLNESYTIVPAAEGKPKTVGFGGVAWQPRPVTRRDTFTLSQGPPQHYRSKSYNHPQSSSGGHPQSSRSINTLHKYNLPSMIEQSAGQRKPVPAYMSMTASAANKRRQFGKENSGGGSGEQNGFGYASAANKRRQFTNNRENSSGGGSVEQNGFGYSRTGAGRRRDTTVFDRPSSVRNFGNSRRMRMAPNRR